MEPDQEHDVDGRPVLRGLALRSFLVLALLAEGRPMTVAELAAAAERQGFALPGRGGKAVSDALRWEVARGRAVRLGRGRYAAGHVAKVTKYRMRRRVVAIRSRRAAPVPTALR